MLLLQYVPGKSLDYEQEAFLPPNLSSALQGLGKVVHLRFWLLMWYVCSYFSSSGVMIICTPQWVARYCSFSQENRWSFSAIFHVGGWTTNQDLLLGNADRLPIQSLGWRGNPANTIWTQGRCVPIDAAVARRPPKLLVRDMDQKATEGVQNASKMIKDGDSSEMIIEVIDPFFSDMFRLQAWSTWFWETVACFLAGRESESTSLPFAYPDLSHSISVHPPKNHTASHLLLLYITYK